MKKLLFFKISKPTLIKIGKWSLIVLGGIFLISFSFFLWETYGWKVSLIGKDTSCIQIEDHKISGSSMGLLLKEGTEVKGAIGYYDCNDIQKEEIAILKFKTREEDFVKRIVGLPGDRLEFIEGNQAKLNGEILKNSEGEPYLFSEISQRLITIPLKDGKIQEGRYLVLSEEPGPSAFDSRQFGFIEKDHFKGRIIK